MMLQFNGEYSMKALQIIATICLFLYLTDMIVYQAKKLGKFWLIKIEQASA